MRPTSHYQQRRVKGVRKINASAETWRKIRDLQHVHLLAFPNIVEICGSIGRVAGCRLILKARLNKTPFPVRDFCE